MNPFYSVLPGLLTPDEPHFNSHLCRQYIYLTFHFKHAFKQQRLRQHQNADRWMGWGLRLLPYHQTWGIMNGNFLANLLPRLLVAFQDMSADTGNVYSLCCCNLTVALFLHFMFYHSCFLPAYISISPTTAYPGWVIHLSKHQLEIKKYILYLMCVILPTIQYV